MHQKTELITTLQKYKLETYMVLEIACHRRNTGHNLTPVNCFPFQKLHENIFVARGLRDLFCARDIMNQLRQELNHFCRQNYVFSLKKNDSSFLKSTYTVALV